MAQQRANIGAGATSQGACSRGMMCGASSVCGDRTLRLLLARSPGMTRALSIGAHRSPKFVQDGDRTQRSQTGAWSQSRAPKRPIHPLWRPSNEPMDSSGSAIQADPRRFREIPDITRSVRALHRSARRTAQPGLLTALVTHELSRRRTLATLSYPTVTNLTYVHLLTSARRAAPDGGRAEQRS